MYPCDNYQFLSTYTYGSTIAGERRLASSQPKIRLTDLKRQKIFDAAIHEFTNRGFEATSMERIAATAQVSIRTVYKHFSGKESLFRAIAQALCDVAGQITDCPYDAEVPIGQQLSDIATRYLELVTSDQFARAMRIATSESISLPEESKGISVQYKANNVGVIKWVEEAVADGKLSVKDTIRAGEQFLSLIEAFALWPQLLHIKPAPDTTEQKKIVESTVEMFLRTYEVRSQNRISAIN